MTATAMPAATNAGATNEMVRLVERAPVAAVDEHAACRARIGRHEEIERFLRAAAVADFDRGDSDRAALRDCVANCVEPVRMLGDRCAVVVAALDDRRASWPVATPCQSVAATISMASDVRPVDAPVQPVADDDGAHTGRRSGEDEVAGHQPVILRQEREHVRNVPDHVAQVAALPPLAVDVERDRAARRACPTRPPDGSARSAPRCANDLPMSHGRFFSRMSFCRSRRVMSSPTA